MTPNTQESYDDELDLFELLETLWAGKWLIMAIAAGAALLSLFLSSLKPNVYTGSTSISSTKASTFTQYTSINETLKSNGFDYTINEKKVFDYFIEEFNDYEEIIDILSQDEDIKSKLSVTEDTAKEVAIIVMAKNFKVVNPNQKTGEWILHFDWNNADKGIQLLGLFVNSVLENTKKRIITDIDILANTIEKRLHAEKERVNAELITVKESIRLETERKLTFLKGQSEIAKELNIKNHELNSAGENPPQPITFTLTLLQPQPQSQPQSQSQSNTITKNAPFNFMPNYYLHGYKAIDAEIKMIKSRSEDDLYLMSSDFTYIMKKLRSLENNVAVSQIKKTKSVIVSDSPNDWVRYNLELSNISSNKKPVKYFLLALAIGGILGSLGVLILNSARNRKLEQQNSDRNLSYENQLEKSVA